MLADETGAHGEGFFDIFIVRRIISPEHRVATFILFPDTEHKAVLFAVGRRQHGISEGGKLSVIGDAIGFHLRGVFVESDIRTHNTDLKKRLLAYSRRYPAICQQMDADPETGCMEFDIAKGRFSFRLTAPYSEERRNAASKAAKKHSGNLTHPIQKDVL